MKFRDLNIGDTFDFIGPDRMLNSYYERCRKISARCYVPDKYEDHSRLVMRVGTINVEVFNVVRS